MVALSLAVLILVIAPAARLWSDEPSKPAIDDYELLKLFADTLDQVERNYVKEIDRRELMEAAIRGMLTKLDPYSNYIPPGDLDRFKTGVENEFGGVGLQVSTEGGELKVISPIFNTPAYRAGIAAGDVIESIDGASAKGMSIEDAVKRMKGKLGTAVDVAIRRVSGGTETFNLKRETVRVETVLGDHRNADDAWSFWLDRERGIAYIRVTGFGRHTPADLKKALETLGKDNVKGLIVDLRNNPGGLLSAAIEIADLFVETGRIVSTAGRSTPEQAWDAKKDGTYSGFPMAVLVNRYSASASEIVSACLQDHKRAIVVGERTYGKGSVQNVVELENGKSAMKLTTAGYLRPSGKNIDKEVAKEQGSKDWGVSPDEGFEVRLGDGEMVRLVNERRQKDIVQIHGKPSEEKPDEKPEETPPEADKPEKPQDRQLNKALEYLTGQLALKN
jgi:carboxyl-terminal processing protease